MYNYPNVSLILFIMIDDYENQSGGHTTKERADECFDNHLHKLRDSLAISSREENILYSLRRVRKGVRAS